MNEVVIYQILEAHGFSKENAAKFVSEVKSQTGDLVTKVDLKSELKDLKIEMLHAMNSLVIKILTGTTAVLSIFKLLEMFK